MTSRPSFPIPHCMLFLSQCTMQHCSGNANLRTQDDWIIKNRTLSQHSKFYGQKTENKYNSFFLDNLKEMQWIVLQPVVQKRAKSICIGQPRRAKSIVLCNVVGEMDGGEGWRKEGRKEGRREGRKKGRRSDANLTRSTLRGRRECRGGETSVKALQPMHFRTIAPTRWTMDMDCLSG